MQQPCGESPASRDSGILYSGLLAFIFLNVDNHGFVLLGN